MLEIADVSKFLNIPEESFEDKESLQKAFDDKDTGYLPRASVNDDDDVKKHFNASHGERMGQMESLVKSLYKEMGVESLEGTLLEDQLKSGTKQLKTSISKIQDEANKSSDERVTSLTTERDDFKSRFESEKDRADNANNLAEKTQTDFSDYKTNLKKNTLIDGAFGTVQLIDAITPIQRKGFMATINETYDFKLPEQGDELEVYVKKTGKRAKSGEQRNKNMSAEDAIKTLADENELLKKNNAAPPPAPTGNPPQPLEVDRSILMRGDKVLAELSKEK